MSDFITESPNNNLQTNSNITNASQLFKCLREMLLALQLVHEKGMVHLDLKPDNIFVHDGLYKLGDFGLAGVATSTDVEEGDSRYMPREMLEGGQRDLTKVSEQFLFLANINMFHTIHSTRTNFHSVTYFLLEPPYMNCVLGKNFPAVVKNGTTYEMAN